jgi:hypothetical protein
MPYNSALLSDSPSPDEIASVVADLETMLVTVMKAIADRTERSSEPFIDTKLDLLTGGDFPEDDPIRGRKAVYAWIQGRGLEALAGHCRWMQERNIEPDLVVRLETIMRQVLDRLRAFRERNGGHLFFFLTPDGEPFALEEGGRTPITLTTDSPWNTSDLFGSKGMYAAACYLGDETAAAEARAYMDHLSEAVLANAIWRDQQPLDPKNPVVPVPGRHSHGSYMLWLLGAAALIHEGEPAAGVELGLKLLRHEFSTHVNVDTRLPEFQDGDVWEFVTDDGVPYETEGRIPSDPGHALELAGLGMKFIDAALRSNAIGRTTENELLDAIPILQRVLVQNFTNGYQAEPGGICKSYDLVSRTAINTDMPWWNLPETVRAAAFCLAAAESDADKEAAWKVLANSHNAFTQHFVRPDLHLMAYQTRAANGSPIAVIPATADADPGYHTGLALIDAVEILRPFKV